MRKLKEKFEGGDKQKMREPERYFIGEPDVEELKGAFLTFQKDSECKEKAMQDKLDWLIKNQLAAENNFEAKQKELEGVMQHTFDSLIKYQLAEKDSFEAKQKKLEGVVAIMMKSLEAVMEYVGLDSADGPMEGIINFEKQQISDDFMQTSAAAAADDPMKSINNFEEQQLIQEEFPPLPAADSAASAASKKNKQVDKRRQ